MQKCLVHVSGGLDSAAAYFLMRHSFEVFPVYYNYGQPYHDLEFRAAEKLVGYKGGHRLRVYDIPMLVDPNWPVKAYVPYRNLVLCAHSINVAGAEDIPLIATGSKTNIWQPGDEGSFKDSSLEPFTRGLNEFVMRITESGMIAPIITMPVVGYTKATVLQIIMREGYDPEQLWTCYSTGPERCGQCRHCKEYEEALSTIAEQDRCAV